jgi:hypothetical protein
MFENVALKSKSFSTNISTVGASKVFNLSAIAMHGQLVNNTIKAKSKQGLGGEIQKRINLLVAEHLLRILYGNLIVPEVTA